jgi:hypothetical protein
MTTVTLHAHVQRSRFAQHAIAALTNLLSTGLRSIPARSESALAAIEAQKVRRLAATYSKTDPGFASDLYAAAARHEGLYAD